eukprot:scaffold41076_cov35-Prasinocladus_malaysianus.AAC.2
MLGSRLMHALGHSRPAHAQLLAWGAAPGRRAAAAAAGAGAGRAAATTLASRGAGPMGTKQNRITQIIAARMLHLFATLSNTHSLANFGPL